jgi:hypothetical protein
LVGLSDDLIAESANRVREQNPIAEPDAIKKQPASCWLFYLFLQVMMPVVISQHELMTANNSLLE